MNKKYVFKSISSLWTGALLGAFLTFFSQVLLARNLGVSSYGNFTASLSLITASAPLIAFGLPGFWLNIFGKEGQGALRWVAPSIKYAAISALIVLFALLLWGIYGPHDLVLTLLIIILSWHAIGLGSLELIFVGYQLEGKFSSLAKAQILPPFLRFLGLLFVFVAFGWSEHILIFSALVYFFVSLLILIWAKKEIFRFLKGEVTLNGHDYNLEGENNGPSVTICEIFKNSWPFGLGLIFHLIYFQSAIFLLRYLSGANESGLYGIAFFVMNAIYLLPGVVYQKFLLPHIHIYSYRNLDLLHKLFKKGNLVMLSLGSLCMVVVWIGSPLFVEIVFGADYSDVVNILSILAICAPFRFLSTAIGSFILVKNVAIKKVKCMGCVAIVFMATCIPVINFFGTEGVAVLTVICEVLLVSLYWFTAKRSVFN